MMILSIWYLHFSPQGPGLSQQIRRRLRGEKSRHICLIEYFSLNTFHWILFNLKSPCVGKIFLIEYFKAPIEYFSIPHQVDSHICKIQYFHSLSVPFNLSSLSIYLFQEIWHNISEYQCPARVGFGQSRSEKWRQNAINSFWEVQVKKNYLTLRSRNESEIKAELENVKSFTRTNINKPDFTPRKSA